MSHIRIGEWCQTVQRTFWVEGRGQPNSSQHLGRGAGTGHDQCMERAELGDSCFNVIQLFTIYYNVLYKSFLLNPYLKCIMASDFIQMLG